MVENFKMACHEMENVTCSDQCEMIKTKPEQCNIITLEETIIRNFETPRQKKAIPLDFDLSKGKLLSNEQNDKWFKLQLSAQQQQQQQQQQQPKTAKKQRKIPFELDYRSVCN